MSRRANAILEYKAILIGLSTDHGRSLVGFP
jgi:hypothetical protein